MSTGLPAAIHCSSKVAKPIKGSSSSRSENGLPRGGGGMWTAGSLERMRISASSPMRVAKLAALTLSEPCAARPAWQLPQWSTNWLNRSAVKMPCFPASPALRAKTASRAGSGSDVLAGRHFAEPFGRAASAPWPESGASGMAASPTASPGFQPWPNSSSLYPSSVPQPAASRHAAPSSAMARAHRSMSMRVRIREPCANAVAGS
jgi:hypothetical protein